MNDKKNSQVGHINSLAGLRFLAAMMVLFYHLDDFLQTKVCHGHMGSTAVSFFFVLSGFILTYVYRDRLKWGGLKRFYFTRWARIWPLHAVCLLWAAYMVPRQPVDFPGLRMASHWLLLQSWIPDRAYIQSFNGVTWSISTEAFFYAMFPLFLLGGLKQFWLKYLGTIGFTALALFAMTQAVATPGMITGGNLYHISYFNPAMRLLEFVSGMATAHLFLSSRIRSLSLLNISRWPVSLQTVAEVVVMTAAGLSYYILDHAGFFYWITSGLGLGNEACSWFAWCGGMPFHALCIFVFAQSNGWLGRFLGAKPMVFLGEISFALYMVHRLVIWFLIKNFWTGSSLPYWAMVSSSVIMTLGFSALLFLLIEMPIKTALVNFYDGKFSNGLKGLATETRSFLAQRTAYLYLAMAFAPALVMGQLAKQDAAQQSAKQIITNTDVTPVKYGSDITLAAWQFEPKRLGTEVSLVWSADKTTLLRHEYQLSGSQFLRKGMLNLQPGETLQKIFVHQRFWSSGEDFAVKLWQKDVLLNPNSKSTTADGTEPVYRIAVQPDGTGTVTQ